jgi:hypothetical protein
MTGVTRRDRWPPRCPPVSRGVRWWSTGRPRSAALLLSTMSITTCRSRQSARWRRWWRGRGRDGERVQPLAQTGLSDLVGASLRARDSGQRTGSPKAWVGAPATTRSNPPRSFGATSALTTPRCLDAGSDRPCPSRRARRANAGLGARCSLCLGLAVVAGRCSLGPLRTRHPSGRGSTTV